MSVLPYCILLNRSKIEIPVSGVKQSGIHRLSEGELLALYSELQKDQIAASNFKSAALEFHNVVHHVFTQAAVVPFRFPTWLGLPELGMHLQQHLNEYKDFLIAHADEVQMEMRIFSPSSQTSHAAAASGTEHLRQRAGRLRELAETANRLRQTLAADVHEWRERELPEGLRLYALVRREHVDRLREKLSMKDSEPGVRWSGPWPPTEFLPEMKQL